MSTLEEESGLKQSIRANFSSITRTDCDGDLSASTHDSRYVQKNKKNS